MKSSLHRLIPFLPLFWNCQFWKLDSVQFLYTQVHIPAGWRLETQHFTSLYAAERFFVTTLHGPRRKHSLYCYGSVLTDPLPSNGRRIVARVGSGGNVFTESLPSNAYTSHNIVRILWHVRYRNLSHLFSICHTKQELICYLFAVKMWGFQFLVLRFHQCSICIQQTEISRRFFIGIRLADVVQDVTRNS
jgi:hypothetical protein